MKDVQHRLDLPPALRPWAELFAAMPAPHVHLLAALVRTLMPLVERAQAFGARPEGEFDSWSGIGTRGGVEHLVVSEWLWREIMPDEFLRRVAERELLTFEPVHRQAADKRTALVILDAGPTMLGRPRLVGFAALLCLAISARDRGARLLWTSNAFAGAGPPWREALTRTDVAAYLEQVSTTALGSPEVEALRQAFRTVPTPRQRGVAEPRLILIGPQGIAAASPAAASVVTIEERPRLDADGFSVAAQVTIETGGRRAATAALDLPDEAMAAALLRQPFRSTSVTGKPSRSAKPQGSKPHRSAEPDPDWALRAFAVTPGGEYLLIAQPDGVLILDMDASFDGLVYRLALARYERLIGLHVATTILTVAIVTTYSERARLIVRSIDLAKVGDGWTKILEFGLKADHPLALHRFARTILPTLGRLDQRRHPRSFWAFAPTGEAFFIRADKVVLFSALRGANLIAIGEEALFFREPASIVARARGNIGTVMNFQLATPPAELAAADLIYDGANKLFACHVGGGKWHLFHTGDPNSTYEFNIPRGEHVMGLISTRANDVVVVANGALRLRDTAGEYSDERLGTGEEGQPAMLISPKSSIVRVNSHSVHGNLLVVGQLDPQEFVTSMTFYAFAADQWKSIEVARRAKGARCLPD